MKTLSDKDSLLASISKARRGATSYPTLDEVNEFFAPLFNEAGKGAEPEGGEAISDKDDTATAPKKPSKVYIQPVISYPGEEIDDLNWIETER